MGTPAYHDGQCSGSTPLVMGAARGRRTFYLDDQGILRGVTYRAAWRDGENEAQCFVTKRSTNTAIPPFAFHSSLWQNNVAPYISGGMIFNAGMDSAPSIQPGFETDACEGLAPDCACGFYAYHSDQAGYAVSGSGCKINGIVEAYGKVILGPKGYRASKARIVAVLVPKPTAASVRRAAVSRAIHDTQEALNSLGEKPAITPLTIATLITGAAAMANGILWAEHRFASLTISGYAALAAIINERQSRAAFNSLRNSLTQDQVLLEQTLKALPNDYLEYIERCRTNYPGVTFYTDTEAMEDEWPVVSLESLAAEARAPIPTDEVVEGE